MTAALRAELEPGLVNAARQAVQAELDGAAQRHAGLVTELQQARRNMTALSGDLDAHRDRVLEIDATLTAQLATAARTEDTLRSDLAAYTSRVTDLEARLSSTAHTQLTVRLTVPHFGHSLII